MVENPLPEAEHPESIQRLMNLLELRGDDFGESWKIQALIDQTLVCVYKDCHQQGLGKEADALITGLTSTLPLR